MQVRSNVVLAPAIPKFGGPADSQDDLPLTHRNGMVAHRVVISQRRAQDRGHIHHRVQHRLPYRCGPNLSRLPGWEHCHRALIHGEPALDVQRRPMGLQLVLGYAVGVLAGMADESAVEQARN